MVVQNTTLKMLVYKIAPPPPPQKKKKKKMLINHTFLDVILSFEGVQKFIWLHF